MKFLKRVFVWMLLGLVFTSYSQKIVDTKTENWTHLYTNLRFSQHLGLNFDVGYRFKDLFESPTQLLMRIGPTFFFNDRVFLQVDVSRFQSYPSNNNTNLVIPEYRASQRLFVNSKKSRFQISQRYRLEQRFIKKTSGDNFADGYRYNYRFGYQINVQMPLKGQEISPNSWYLNVYDELFVNFGKQIIYNHFDQNRVFVGLGYQISTTANAVMGYQYTWQQARSGNTFNSIHTVRVTFTKNFDFRKEE